MKYFDGIKKGDKVWDFIYGEGKVYEIEDADDIESYVINVKFKSGLKESYNLNGRRFTCPSCNQSLFWGKIIFKVPKKPTKLPKPEEFVRKPEGRSVKINECCKVYENGIVVCNGKVKRPTVTPSGLFIRINRKNCKLSKAIHILVAETFLKKPKDDYYYDVNHKNGNLYDNRLENLEWKRRGEKLMIKRNYKASRRWPIAQIDPNTGEVVKEWMSAKEAAYTLGMAYSNLIKAINKNEKYRDYFWKRLKKD